MKIIGSSTSGNSQILVTAGVGLNADCTRNVKVAIVNSYVTGITSTVVASLTQTNNSVSRNAIGYEVNVFEMFDNATFIDFLKFISFFLGAGIFLTVFFAVTAKILSNIYAQMLGKE